MSRLLFDHFSIVLEGFRFENIWLTDEGFVANLNYTQLIGLRFVSRHRLGG